jgi:nucleotide-binding universal stress UspA family protein
MDFSEAARLSLESVLRLCPQAERVAVLHNYDTSYDLVLNQAASVSRFLEYRREAGEHARATLHQYLTPYRDAGVRLEALIRSGETAESILEVARQQRADLIAVGRHSRTVLGRLIRPHVAEQIASNAPGDVLVQLA